VPCRAAVGTPAAASKVPGTASHPRNKGLEENLQLRAEVRSWVLCEYQEITHEMLRPGYADSP